MESGLYVTFVDRDEPHDRELPPVGPLDHLVVRHRQLIAQRGAAHQAEDLGVPIDRWLEAELEYQRATGEEPGGPKRSDVRVSARDGVFVRFATFGDPRERDIAPELGPFAVVHVGPRGVEADGQMLATRDASELAPWQLTSGAGLEVAGLRKPDIAFRSASGAFDAAIAQPGAPPDAPPAAPPAATPAAPVFEPLFTPREEPATYTPPTFVPPVEEPPALTSRDLELIERIERDRAEETLRARIQSEERRRLGVDASDEAASTWAIRYRPQDAEAPVVLPATTAGRGPGELLWRLRFVLIGLLLLSAGIYGFTVIRGGGTSTVPGQGQLTFLNVAQKVSGARWDYVVNGVQRVSDAGTAHARGIFYVVRIGVTNKGTEGAQLSPSEFTLVDANGVEHSASGLASGVYQGADNPGSPYAWPAGFPVGRTLTFAVVFDVDVSLGRGNLLRIADLPSTRVRLD